MSSKRTLPLFQVDAFTETLFAGNPAAVVPLDAWLTDDLLQQIAAENNLAETAFFVRTENEFELRWFTPTLEIDLCGHATLAAAHVLYEHQGYEGEQVVFHSMSGPLIVRKKGSQLQLDFPARPPVEVEAPQELLDGLSIKPDLVLKSRDYIAVYKDEETVKKIQPNHTELSKLDCIGIAVTAPGDDVDCVSRFFAPAAGVPEDPVTGSVHCSIVPYWSDRLEKSHVHARQVSQRSGDLYASYQKAEQRVLLAGKAVTYLRGFIEV